MGQEINKTENTHESISVEQLQTENEILKTRVTELETLNNDLKVDNDKLKETCDFLNTILVELTDVKTDTKSNRTENKKGEVKIKILLSPAGRFLLPFNVDQVVLLSANQADELVDCKYAEYVK